MKDSYGMEILEGDLLLLRIEGVPFEFRGVAKKDKEYDVWYAEIFYPEEDKMTLNWFDYIEAYTVTEDPLKPVLPKWEKRFWDKFYAVALKKGIPFWKPSFWRDK